MTDAPHVPAAFINAIAEEGTKDEAIAFLQKQWDENCELRAAMRRIWEIVHTPSRATNHKGAADHFMADFDAIRKILKASGTIPDRFQADASEVVR